MCPTLAPNRPESFQIDVEHSAIRGNTEDRSLVLICLYSRIQLEYFQGIADRGD